MDDVKKTSLKTASQHGIQAPLALLAELSHRCPLQCPYCSNPVQLEKKTGELSTDEWKSVIGQAVEMGMIYKAFSEESFENESWELAKKLAKMPTKGLALTKKLLNASYTNNLEEQLKMEENCQKNAANTEDFKEGVNAFLEKRKPNFKGK